MSSEEEYKSLISNILQTTQDEIFLYWKGRVALFAILKAIGVTEGDEVIIPAFTCVVVPNAIKYLGAIPIYVDINTETYNVDSESVVSKISDKTKVIICQNTFGLSSQMEELNQLAQQRGIFTIEDCTHGFGGTYHNKPNGSYCDAAFFSTQWNKPFSTGIGGFAYVKNEALREKLRVVNEELLPATAKDAISLSVLYFVRDWVLNDFLYWKMIKFYRFLSKYKIVQGSSSGEELLSPTMPDNYFKHISNTQIKKGIRNIGKLSDNISLRKKNAKFYTDYLMNLQKTYVPYNYFEDHSFLKYPILVKNRPQFLKWAEEAHIPLGEWFCSPIHPIEEHLEKWDFDASLFPSAVKASSMMVNLPTDVKDVHRVIAFLERVKDEIL